MAAMETSTQLSDQAVEKRRAELYGNSRRDAVRKMKGSLTQDHIHLLVQEGQNAGLPPWSSTTKTAFMGSQPKQRVAMSLDSGMQKVKLMQNSSHFEMRGDCSPIDGNIYKASLTNADYNHKKVSKLPSMKLDPQINLPDMNPRYFDDHKFGESFYNTDFSEMIKQHAGPPPVNQTSEIRRRNVKDLRTSHFQFGNDSQSFQTETGTSYDPSRPRSTGIRLNPIKHAASQSRRPRSSPRTVPSSSDLSPAQFVKKMLADERESYVFRNGDYNVKVPKEDISTFSRDFNAKSKPNKAAAFVEPTQIPKGRFLQDANELKGFLMEETMPWASEESSSAKIPEHHLTNLRQLFAQYDRKGTGYVSKPIMHRILNSLLDPIPSDQVEHLLRFTTWGEDGSINYIDFIKKYQELEPLPKPAIPDGLGTYTTDKLPGTAMSAGASHGSPCLDTAAVGKSYQTSVHFQFGSDKEKPSSIYNKDFDTGVQQDTAQALKKAPPPSSEVMHKVPGVGFGSSSKQTSFVDFTKVDAERMRQIFEDRNKMSNKNKRRHNLNSVIMTCDPNRDAIDRQASLSHDSYITHTDSKPEQPCEPHQPKYPYLKSDLALPFTARPRPKVSEARDAFCGPNISNVDEEQGKLREFKQENRERVKDGKRVHFQFGNDDPNHETEAMDQFTHGSMDGAIMPAGKLNAEDPNYPHFESSKNTLDLGGNPMAPNNIDRINMAKKTYYHTLNPEDPLHIRLRHILMEKDPEHTGHVTKRELKDACGKFQINFSNQALDRIIQRCDKHGDGSSIDYHQFVRGLTMEQIPEGVSAPHSTSIMRNDYKPIEQRSFTDAQLVTIDHMTRKPIKPQPSHFFHTDSMGDNSIQSMTTQDFIRPEFQT